jgi:hypothetical protein
MGLVWAASKFAVATAGAEAFTITRTESEKSTASEVTTALEILDPDTLTSHNTPQKQNQRGRILGTIPATRKTPLLA